MISSKFTDLCNYDHNLNLEYFHCAKINAMPISSYFPFHYQPQASTNVFSVSIYLPFQKT